MSCDESADVGLNSATPRSMSALSSSSLEEPRRIRESASTTSSLFQPLLAHDDPNIGSADNIPDYEQSPIFQQHKPSYDSLDSTGARSRNSERAGLSTSPSTRVGPFWVPPLIWESNASFRVVTVPDQTKPKQSRFAPGPFVAYDYILSAILLNIAARLVKPSLQEIPLRTLAGAVLFQAGLVTAVVAFYTIVATCGRRCIRWEDGLAVIAIAISIYLAHPVGTPWQLPYMSKNSSWQFFLGASLFEAVLIHAISRGLFLLPIKDDAITMLTLEVESMQTSLALGLAEHYFQRVRSAGHLVKEAEGSYLSVTYQNPVGSRDGSLYLTDDMDVPCIFIAVPRYADWSERAFILERKQSYLRAGRVIECCLATSEWENRWLCVTGMHQGFVVDVAPSPLQLVVDNIRDDSDYSDDDYRTLQYQKEVHRFSQRLAWLVKRDGLEKHVKIVEFEHDIMAHLPNAGYQILRNLGHVALGHNASSGPQGLNSGADMESGVSHTID